jgi:hypothetical protein
LRKIFIDKGFAKRLPGKFAVFRNLHAKFQQDWSYDRSFQAGASFPMQTVVPCETARPKIERPARAGRCFRCLAHVFPDADISVAKLKELSALFRENILCLECAGCGGF